MNIRDLSSKNSFLSNEYSKKSKNDKETFLNVPIELV